MALYNAFDRSKHFSELTSGLPSSKAATGALTPQQRRQECLANLGLVLANAATGLGAEKRQVPAPATATDTATITATQMANGLMICTPTAAATYTLPTGTNFETQLAALNIVLGVDEGFDFTITNVATTAAFIITVATAAGWTLVGGMLVEANAAAQAESPVGIFRVRRTAANTYTLYRVG